LGALLLIIPLFLITSFTIFIYQRTQKAERQRQAEVKQDPQVTVLQAKKSPSYREIELTGEARPFLTIQVFARVSGYLKEILVDKGDRVRKNQTLAVIESPETDRAYLSALADAKNKQRMAKRSRILRKKKLISQQEADQAIANSEIATANLGIQKVLKSYEQIYAPFAGTITGRFVDPGALIQNATNGQSNSQVLFNLSQTHQLRIYVYVDQKDALDIHPGIPAEISLHENPNTRLDEKVTRISGELDVKTRTLLAEIDIDNHNQQIIAGSFVQVRLKIPIPAYVEIPMKALVIKGDRNFVQIVHPDQTIHYRPIEVGETDGQKVQVLSGLQEGESFALNAGNAIEEGQKIQIHAMLSQNAPGGERIQ
jgi:RND family efflux transporter MFP subunit